MEDKAKVEVLLKLYTLASEQEKFYIGKFYDNLKFYWSIISFMFSGFSVGVFKVKSVYECIILLIIPIALYGVTLFFERTVVRNYGNFVEAIVTKAKVEVLLGFDKWQIPENSEYWQGDVLLNSRYLSDRRRFNDSREFESYVFRKVGVNRIWQKFFFLVKVLSIAMEIYLIVYLWIL